MSNGGGFQATFLEALCQNEVPVAVYLVNGIKLQGVIEAYDDMVVMLKGTAGQIIYKHAISTIVPAREVRFKVADEEVTRAEAEQPA